MSVIVNKIMIVLSTIILFGLGITILFTDYRAIDKVLFAGMPIIAGVCNIYLIRQLKELERN